MRSTLLLLSFSVLRKIIPQALINYAEHLPIAVLANMKYGFPSKELVVIGVTGTDGKTTTSSMLYYVLLEAGFKVALISTVSAKIGDQEIDTGFHVTSPEPLLLQKLLRRIADQGFTHVILEVTSHGLDQFRFWGIHFTGGVVTNITQDHLDYHKTWEKYALAKSKLFTSTSFAVLNENDKSYQFLKPRVSGRILPFGNGKGIFKPEDFNLKILGDFNRLNATAAALAASELGVSQDKIMEALATFPGVKGRMEVLQEKPIKIVVDFAHTPNALEQALSSLKKQTKGRLISIFGCAGDRDKNRRKMGKVSAELADITIITAEDPRTEDINGICSEIAAWAKKGGANEFDDKHFSKIEKKNYPVYLIITDRRQAINFALIIAREGDTVGIFGKGHEKTMCFGNKEIPWSDQETVKEMLLNVP